MLASVANWALQPVAPLDYVNLLSWLLFTGTLMLILANGHDHLWSNIPGVSRLLGDESTTENRRLAQASASGPDWSAGSASRLPRSGSQCDRQRRAAGRDADARRGGAILEQRALNP